MEHTKTKGYTMMLHHFGQQLTEDVAVSIAEVYGLPGSIVDEIERNHPGRSLIRALKQKDIISEDQNILKEFHDTLKQMNYIDLTNIIEDEYPQLKQAGPLKDRQASDNSETPVTSNHPRLDSTAPPGGITEDEEPLVSSENEEAPPVSFQTSDAPATPLATSPPGSNSTAPTEETVDEGKQMTSQKNIQGISHGDLSDKAQESPQDSVDSVTPMASDSDQSNSTAAFETKTNEGKPALTQESSQVSVDSVTPLASNSDQSNSTAAFETKTDEGKPDKAQESPQDSVDSVTPMASDSDQSNSTAAFETKTDEGKPALTQDSSQVSVDSVTPLASDSDQSNSTAAFETKTDEGKPARGKTEEKSATVSQEEFQSYLERVGLNEQYPAKMTLKMATKIRILKQNSPTMTKTDIPLLFLTMLTSLDRRVVFPEKLNFNVSVRDFICALLHCSDDFLRQHILEKLAACQLAVPIVIPTPTGGKPIFLLWALRRIAKKWKDDKDSFTPERNMVTEPLFTVAFVRVGELPVSKSHILNNMFGRAQSNATVAYFISKREDCEYDATFSKGLLEAHWYVPSTGKEGEILQNVTLFLNLRGDANDFPKQVTFTCKVANMVFILVDKAYESQNKKIIDMINHFSSNVVTVYLTEKKKNTNCQGRNRLTETTNRLDYEVDGEDIVLSKALCKHITLTCDHHHTKNYTSIEDWLPICRSFDIGITVDEDHPICKTAFKQSEEIFEKIIPLTVQNIKKQYMTLQTLEFEWVKWDQKRPTRNEGSTFANQEDNIRRNKLNIRMKQRSRGLTSEMLTFYETLRTTTLCEDRKLLHYFIAYFQSKIDGMVKKEIPPHITKISMLELDLVEKKRQLKQEKNRSSIRSLEKNIAKLREGILWESKEYSHKHIGFEHFMRELSHIFEAQIVDAQSYKEETQMIATLAARLLIDGYPLEILDGDTAYISITWISNVLNIVDTILNSPKIFVISVIGVQSSGKSTLLNSMFGVRFAVRAGRCTRGLFLQIIEVDDTLQESLGFQYLFIIDTEGLQSPDRTVQNDFKFDNALATLAMCVVDLSILNISQETIGADMIGILQIAAHALIRMKRVKLVSQCRIVHQRVSDVNAAGENKSSMNVIKEALDRAIFAAAKEENITSIREFSDVFSFAENDNFYIPCLWMSNMSPPNHAYSEAILNLKSQLLSRKGSKEGTDFTQFTLKKFQNRLEDVWNALKKEDFVFNFQNSFNALSYQRFRLEHNKWVGIMRTAMVEWELTNKENIKEGNKEPYKKELKKEIERHLDKVLKEIDEYVSTHPDEEEVIRQQNTFKISSKNISREIENSIKDNFTYFMKTQKEKASLPNFMEKCKMMLRENAKQEALKLLQVKPSLDPKTSEPLLDRKFETIWNDTIEKAKKNYEDKKVKDDFIISACENSLSTLIDNTQFNLKFQNIIAERMTEKPVSVQREQEVNPSREGWLGGLLSMSSRMFHKLRRQHRDSDEQEQTGKDRTKRIDRDRKKLVKRLAQEELKTFKDDKRFEAFDKSHIDSFFTALLEKLREHMQLADEVAINTLVDTCDDIVHVSIEKQRQYEKNFSLYKLMEVEKTGLKKDFLSFFDNTITTERVADKTYSELCAKIYDVLVDDLNVKLLERLRKLNCFIDKQILIGTILFEICNNESEEDYLEFVSNQDSYTKQWLLKKIIEEVTKQENSRLWIERVASEKLSRLTQIIEHCLHKAKTHFEAKPVELEDAQLNLPDPSSLGKLRKSQERSIPISEWQTIFVKMCKEEKLGIDLEPMIFDSFHYIRFTDMLLKMIKQTSVKHINFDPELKTCVDPKNANRLISKMEINPYLDILKHVQGCSHVCPFCKVGCHRQGEHSKHAAILHYPQGVAGFADEHSKELVVDIQKSLSFTYRFNQDKDPRPYKDYQSEFPTWVIRPIPKDEPNTHWQWVMARFNERFAENHGAKPGVIPDGWKALTKDEALSSLKQFYNLD